MRIFLGEIEKLFCSVNRNCLIVNTKWIYPGPGIEFSPDGQNINIHTLLTFNVFFNAYFTLKLIDILVISSSCMFT